MAHGYRLHDECYYYRRIVDESWSGIPFLCGGLQGIDNSQFEAGYVDGVKNRWQELWYITLPGMKPMLLFGAVMAITQTFGVADQTMALCGFLVRTMRRVP